MSCPPNKRIRLLSPVKLTRNDIPPPQCVPITATPPIKPPIPVDSGIKKLALEMQNLKEQLTFEQYNNSYLKSKLDALQSESISNQSIKDTLSKQIQDLTFERNEAMRDLEEINEKYQIAYRFADLNNDKLGLADIEQQKLSKEIRQLNSQVEQLENTLGTKDKKIQQHKKQLKQQEDQLKEEHKQLDTLLHAKYHNQLDAIVEEIHLCHNEIEKILSANNISCEPQPAEDPNTEFVDEKMELLKLRVLRNNLIKFQTITVASENKKAIEEFTRELRDTKFALGMERLLIQQDSDTIRKQKEEIKSLNEQKDILVQERLAARLASKQTNTSM